MNTPSIVVDCECWKNCHVSQHRVYYIQLWCLGIYDYAWTLPINTDSVPCSAGE